MPGLPKIALARLKAQTDATKSSGASGGPADFQGGQHPDANLLAAFVEKTLTERERTQMLAHLSQCADCREVAALSMAPEAAMAQPVRVAAGRRWNPWLVLRWGAMAAVLGAVTVVVVLHPGMYRHHDIAMVTSQPTSAGKVMNAPPPVATQPSPPSPAQTAQTRASANARESAGEMTAMAKVSGAQRDLSLQDNEERAESKKQVTSLDSTRPPGTVRADNLPSVKTEKYESKGGTALTAEALSAPSPPPAPAGRPMAVPQEAGRAIAASPAAPATLHATTESVAVTAEAETSRTPAIGVGAGGGNGNFGASREDATAAKAAPRASASGSLRMKSLGAMGGAATFSKDKELEAGPAAALWTISSDGQVQRTMDAGKTLQSIYVAHGIKFQTVAALGNDVWAGGTGGALYHSVDGGATWRQVAITIDENTVTETLTDIQLHDPQHLTVTTTSGSQWVSEDGGQHWQKKT